MPETAAVDQRLGLRVTLQQWVTLPEDVPGAQLFGPARNRRLQIRNNAVAAVKATQCRGTSRSVATLLPIGP